jgi:hypothetical protein
MTFNGLAPDGAAVPIYSESGFSISANPGSWAVRTTYGNPAPFVQFRAPGGNVVTGQIQVTAEGFQPFTFNSVDLYSSTTQIPYTIVGTKRAAVVFSVEGSLPNTFGNFRTVVNPHGTDAIDTLTIILVNSAAPCCSNPMGLDNIALNQ